MDFKGMEQLVCQGVEYWVSWLGPIVYVEKDMLNIMGYVKVVQLVWQQIHNELLAYVELQKRYSIYWLFPVLHCQNLLSLV